MVPVSSLLDIYDRPDSGYCTIYQFSKEAAFAIRQQGDATGFARFPVYSDRLWIDLDAADSSPSEVDRVKNYARELTARFKAENYTFSVWFSGSKGYHICLRITPMQGREVPYSQLQYVQNELKIQCDFSLYQHGRLLSNPGRLHPKTGIKKHKIYEFNGGRLLEVPLIPMPEKLEISSGSLQVSDLARIGFQRLASFTQDAPLAGMRHTKMWSLASGLFEAGMSFDLVFGNLCYVNQFLPDPKPIEEVRRACEQAAHQLGVK
jgi:hypothetical protein